jgi:hypothetical protein
MIHDRCRRSCGALHSDGPLRAVVSNVSPRMMEDDARALMAVGRTMGLLAQHTVVPLGQVGSTREKQAAHHVTAA